MSGREGTPPKPRADEAPGEAFVEGVASSVAKKTACWVCGGDLTFNSLRASGGTVHVQLYCKRCGVPRRMALHL